MSLYKACLIGSDIGRAPYFELTAHTLRGAKRQATALFGNGFAHHTIAVWQKEQDKKAEREIEKQDEIERLLDELSSDEIMSRLKG